MKIVEALKKVKSNRSKISDLNTKIGQIAAHMESSVGSLPYKDPKAKVKEFTQAAFDTQQDNARLLSRIQKTNLINTVTIELGGVQVTKTIAEWVYRRREGVDHELETYRNMATRLKPGAHQLTDGSIQVDNVIRNYDEELKDRRMAILNEEKSLIDSALEIVNAITDLEEL